MISNIVRRPRPRLAFDFGVVATISRRTRLVSFVGGRPSGLAEADPDRLDPQRSLDHTVLRCRQLAAQPEAPTPEALGGLLRSLDNFLSRQPLDPEEARVTRLLRAAWGQLAQRIACDWPQLADLNACRQAHREHIARAARRTGCPGTFAAVMAIRL
jgi:hypothetical protein